MEKQNAETTAGAFVEKIALTYGAPQILQTDQGANFMSEVFQHSCRLLKIKKIQSTAFHPQSQGGLERSHHVLAKYLRHYVSEDQANWDSWVPLRLTCIIPLNIRLQVTHRLNYYLDTPQPYPPRYRNHQTHSITMTIMYSN